MDIYLTDEDRVANKFLLWGSDFSMTLEDKGELNLKDIECKRKSELRYTKIVFVDNTFDYFKDENFLNPQDIQDTKIH